MSGRGWEVQGDIGEDRHRGPRGVREVCWPVYLFEGMILQIEVKGTRGRSRKRERRDFAGMEA
jgi:hypothetical protein